MPSVLHPESRVTDRAELRRKVEELLAQRPPLTIAEMVEALGAHVLHGRPLPSDAA
jgi:hypothetical protein